MTVRSSYGGGDPQLRPLQPRRPAGGPLELGASPFGVPIVFIPSIRQAGGEYGITLQATDISAGARLSRADADDLGHPWAVVHNDQRGNCLNEVEPGFGWAKCSVGPPAEPTTPTRLPDPADLLRRPARLRGRGELLAASRRPPPQPPTSGAPLAGCDRARLRTDRVRPAHQPPRLLAQRATTSTSRRQRRRPGRCRPGDCALAGAQGGGDPARRDDDQPLGRRRPRRLHHRPSTRPRPPSSPPGAGCPNDSKIGDFTVESPLFAETIEGAIFLFLAAPAPRTPSARCSPLYLVAKAPERGILVKVAGKLDADPGTGRLTATFDDLPQLPYSHFNVHFREGQRSPLATPAGLRHLRHRDRPHPLARPERRSATPTRRFTLAAGIGGGPCPPGPPPFAPRAERRHPQPNAGSYTPFYLHLTRTDAEQEITSYSATLPPGPARQDRRHPLLPRGGDRGGQAQHGGAEERTPLLPGGQPDRPHHRRLRGRPVLAYAPGQPLPRRPLPRLAALGGRDRLGHGRALRPRRRSSSARRSGSTRQTAQVSIDSAGSDPIPHILDGIPLHLRDIRVYIDRPNFTLNPTSCEPLLGRLDPDRLRRRASPTPPTTPPPPPPTPSRSPTAPRSASSRKLGLRAQGRHQARRLPVAAGDRHARARRRQHRRRRGHPAALDVPRPGPHRHDLHASPVRRRQLPGRTRSTATPRAITPLLAEPLEGPVYLRSSANTLPDLVAALRGARHRASTSSGAIDSVQRRPARHLRRRSPTRR